MRLPAISKTKQILRALIIFSAVLFGFGRAQAITISPVRVEVSAAPGETVASEFKVYNEEQEPQTFLIDFENFEASGETGAPSFRPGREDLAGWIRTTNRVVVAPGERLTIPFHIAVPPEAEPGGHFAAIFLGTTPPAGGQVSLSGKVGILVLLRVTGEIAEGGGVIEFSTKNQERFFGSLPVDFFYRFHNDGGDRVRPTGDLVIKNWWGGVTTKIVANPTEGNILPGSTRRFELRWGTAPSSRSWWQALKSDWRNFALGRYTVGLDLVYASDLAAAAPHFAIWIFPWRLLLTLFLALIVLLGLIVLVLRRYNRWVIERARQSGLLRGPR